MLVVLTTFGGKHQVEQLLLKPLFLLELLSELSIYIYIYRGIIIFRTLDKNGIPRQNDVVVFIWCSHKYEKDKKTNVYIT